MTTSYERLREECNKRLPDRLELKFGCEVMRYDNRKAVVIGKLHKDMDGKERVVVAITHPGGYQECIGWYIGDIKPLGPELTITDVLRVLAATRPKSTSFYIEDDGNLWQCTAPLGDNLLCTFDLSLQLSAPENNAACEAVLALLDNKNV